MSTFDVWVIRFQGGGEVSPAEGLQRIFGIDAAAAAEVEQTVPRVVKHRVRPEAAEQMRRALESIGAVVECRPARPGRRVEEAVSRPPEGISIPVAASAERLKIEPPVMGTPALSASLAPMGQLGLSASEPVARPPQPRPAPPMSHPLPTPGPQGLGAEPAVQVEPAWEEPEAPLVRLDNYLDDLFGNRRRRCFVQAFAMIALAIVIFGIGQSKGNSIFVGDADWQGVGFAGCALYLLGVAGHELYTLVRG
jgi:hypothetical protein